MMERTTMELNGLEYDIIQDGNDVFIKLEPSLAALLTKVETASVATTRKYDVNAGRKFYTKVEYYLANGVNLKDMKPADFRNVKRSVAQTYLSNIKRMSVDKEPNCNAKRIIRRVRKLNCTNLLAVITP